jgi:tetratricopeptide (TPR) repeat protein
MATAVPKTRSVLVRLALLLLVLLPMIYLLVQQRQQIAEEQRVALEQRRARDAAMFPQRTPPQPDPLVTATFPDGVPQTKTRPLTEALQNLTAQAQQSRLQFQRLFGPVGARRFRYRPPTRLTTQKDASERQLEYWLRDVRYYRACTRDHAEIRPQAEQFLTAATKWRLARPDALPRDELRALGVELLVAGSQDPVVLLAYAHVIEEFKVTDSIMELVLRPAILGLPGTQYPKWIEVRLRSLLPTLPTHRVLPGDDRPRTFSDRYNAFQAALYQWLRDDSQHKQFLRPIAANLDDLQTRNHLRYDTLLRDIADDPEIDPWLLHVMAGEHFYDAAWNARGSGFANDVTPAGWDQFQTQMEQAALHFRHAWLLHPEHPRTAWKMINVANANGDENRTPADWIQHAVAAQLDYVAAYNAYRHALWSRWGGSPEELIEFAQECVSTGRYDTLIPFQLLDVIKDLKEMEKIPFSEQLAQYPLLEQVLTKFLAGYDAWNDDQAPRLETTWIPEFPWRLYHDAKRWDDAHQIAKRYPFQRPGLFLQRWDALPSRYDLDLSLASGSPEHLDLITRLDARLRRAPLQPLEERVLPQIEADLARLRKLAPADEVGPALARFEALFAQRKAWDAGEWVTLLEGPDAPGCEFFADQVFYNEDEQVWQLVGQGNHGSRMGVIALLDFEAPLEIQCRMQVEPSNTSLDFVGIQWREAAGVRTPDDKGWTTFMQSRPYFGTNSTSYKQLFVPTIDPRGFLDPIEIERIDTPINYLIRLWPRSFEFVLESFSYQRRLAAELDPEGRLFFGEPTHTQRWRSEVAKGVISFHHIRVRRLSSAPAPDESAPPAERLTYWEQRHQRDATDVLALRELARTACETDPEQALSLARRALEITPGLNEAQGIVGSALLKQGKAEEAFQVFDAVLSSEYPPMYETLLGWAEAALALPVTTTEQLDRINSGMTQFADARGGDKVRLKSVQAEAYFRLGKFHDAIASLNEAIQLAPPNDPRLPELNQRLAQCQKAKTKP